MDAENNHNPGGLRVYIGAKSGVHDVDKQHVASVIDNLTAGTDHHNHDINRREKAQV